MYRLGGLHAFAEARGVNRNITPAEESLAFFSHYLFNDGFAKCAPFRVARQKDMAHGIMTGLGESEAELLALFA